MSESVTKAVKCQWIKNEPFEEHVTNNLLDQFQSESELSEDMTVKDEDSNGETISCGDFISEQRTSKPGAISTRGKSKRTKRKKVRTKGNCDDECDLPITFSGNKISSEFDAVNHSSIDVKIEKTNNSDVRREPSKANCSRNSDEELTATFADSDSKMAESENVAMNSVTRRKSKRRKAKMRRELQTEAVAKDILDVVKSESKSIRYVDAGMEGAASSEDEQKCGEPSSVKSLVPKSDQPSKPKKRGRKSATGPFTCDVCSKIFDRRFKLKRHMLIHSGKKTFQCDVCGKWFLNLGSLNSHMMVHTGLKPYICEVCGKSYTHASYLKQHHYMIHVAQESFPCDLCEKSFTRPGYLKQHRLSHAAKKSYTCDLCEKIFPKPSLLKVHILSHSGEKQFSCDQCGKRFTHSHSLLRHRVVHTGQKAYACDVCGKTFTQSCNLKTHKLIHTGEKAHACDECGKRFLHSGHLNRHKLIHVAQRKKAIEDAFYNDPYGDLVDPYKKYDEHSSDSDSSKKED